MKTTRKSIDDFLAARELAIAGVSRNPKKFGYIVYSELKKRGFKIYPLNPNAGQIDGDLCYPGLSSLPPGVRHLLILTPKAKTLDLVKEAVDKGFQHIWIQQMSDTAEAVQLARSQNINLVCKQCILLYIEPVKGIHKFHLVINNLFGLSPK